MNIRHILLSLGASFAVGALFSCENNAYLYRPADATKTEEVGTVASTQKLNVTISQKGTTASTATLSFSPSDKKTPYISVLIPRAMYIKMDAKDIPTQALAQLKEEATASKQPLDGYLKSIQKVGDQTITVKNLAPNTDYAVLTFSSTDGKLGNYVANDKFYFTTMLADIVPMTFDVKTELFGNKVTLNVSPSVKDNRYYLCVIPKKLYDNLKKLYEAFGKKDVADAQIVTAHFENTLRRLVQGQGMDFKEAVDQLLKPGDLVFRPQGLDYGTDYVYLIAGFVVSKDYESVVINTEITKGGFTTEALKLKDVNFNIKISNQTNTSFGVKISPDDPDVIYLWRYQPYTIETKDMTPDELAQNILANTPFIGSWDKNKGVKEFSSLPLIPGNKYYVIVFGISGKTQTTHAQRIEFSTGEPADASSLTLSTHIDKVSPYNATVSFTPSDNGIFYAMGLIPDGQTTADSIKTAFQKDIINGFQAWGAVNKGRTITDFLSSYYFSGFQPFTFQNLKPETTYTLFTFAIDQKGTIAAVHEEKSFLTTPALSKTCKITPELFGVFDGDQIDTTIFNDPERAKGQAVVVVKSQFTDATKGFVYLVPETFRKVELDPTKIPDGTLLQLLQNVLVPSSPEKPYNFFTCNWDQTQVFLSIGSDSHNVTGKVLRQELTTPTKEHVDDISKLKNLVVQINGNSTSTDDPSSQLVKSAPLKERFKTDNIAKKDELTAHIISSNLNNTYKKTEPTVDYTNNQQFILPVFRVIR